MKKILPSLIGVLLSFCHANAEASTVTQVPDATAIKVSVQLGLQSEPIDLEGTSRPQTVFITAKTLDKSIPQSFGFYVDGFELYIDPNECKSDKNGTTCTEAGSQTVLAKLSSDDKSLILYNNENPEEKLDERMLANRRTGEPIKLSIEKVRVPNDPGKPYEDIYLVAKDSTGTRKAKLHPQLRLSH